MTPSEREAPASLGLTEASGDRVPLCEALAIREMLVASSLPLTEAAQIIGVDPGTLRERLEEEYLIGVWLAGDHWRVLASQLTEKGALPGLDMILGRVPKDINPVKIYAFITTPQPRLMRHGRMVESVEWLASGEDPEIVVDLARSL